MHLEMKCRAVHTGQQLLLHIDDNNGRAPPQHGDLRYPSNGSGKEKDTQLLGQFNSDISNYSSSPVAREVRMVVSDMGEHTFPNMDAPRMQAKQW